MNRKLPALAAMLLGIGLAWQSASADGLLEKRCTNCAQPPACEPGYKIVEEIVYKDIVKTVCRMVPVVRTKWVYSCVDDPICLKDSRNCNCPQCGVYPRKVLVKKLVDLPCESYNCVPEKIVETVAVKVYKKIPCAPVVAAPPPAVTSPPPAVKPMPKAK